MEQMYDGVKLFLDDCRTPEDCLGYMHQRIGRHNPIYACDWVVVRNYDQFVTAVKAFRDDISIVSFDHDLEYVIEGSESGEDINDDNAWQYALEDVNAKTGYDCAKWLVEFFGEDKLPIILIHSMNPVGCDNIKSLFSKTNQL